MKYLLRIDEARVTWADKIKDNNLRIINSALRQNPEININDIKDVLLELFDMIGVSIKVSIIPTYKMGNDK